MGEDQKTAPQVGNPHCPCVSVLVAVYNSAAYLRDCLESLLGQTYRQLEVICVDDCSTDNSLEILHEYQTKDSRVKVLHLDQNQGQAVARNRGLEIATGSWIATVDSDDWLAADAIEKTMEALATDQELDTAVFQLMEFYSADDCHPYPLSKQLTTGKVISGREAFELSLDWQLHGLYVVRADIHKAYPFDATSRLYSDDNTTRLHYLHSRKVVLTDGQYFYRKHGQSATNAVSVNRFLYLDANLSMKRQLLEEAEKGVLDDAAAVLDRYETIRWLNIVDACWYYSLHRGVFTAEERQTANTAIKKAFDSIEPQRINPKISRKFGYYPFRSYSLFRSVENIYFFLRKILGRG